MNIRKSWVAQGFVKRLLAGIAWAMVIGVIGGRLIIAQLPTASVLGTAKDGTGAVVPGATLTARQVETGLTRTAVTSADGSYRLAALPVGTYELQIEHPGFRKEVRSGLRLSVGEEAVLNFTLEVGAVEQSVEVTSQAPLVNTTSGSLSSLVSEERMADLPLNGRSYVDLTLLQPGIIQHKNAGGASFLTGTWYSSNGAPPRSNTFLLDGANMLTIGGAQSASITGNTLGIDGIREYRVITNSFSAEYGLTMGSQTTLVSKNGTNQLHGSLFEYLRNSVLDARNFFDYTTSRRLPAFTRNQFGASAGGPIRKDKTFYFGTYEGLRERLGATLVATSIAAGCHGPANVTITNTQCPQLGPSTPSVTIAPVAARLVALYPIPNLPNNRFTFPFRQPTGEDFGQVRADQTFSDNDTLFGRYTVDDARQVVPVTFPQFSHPLTSRGHFVTLSENHVFSPTLLNTARFSFSRTLITEESPSGISGPDVSFITGQEIGNINLEGVTTFGPTISTPVDHAQNIFTWSDDLFLTRGRHSLKFGTLINRYQQNIFVATNVRGSVTFPDVASLLLGRPSNYTALTPGSNTHRNYDFKTAGFYAQDDLRVFSNFTLNLGLRYEFHTTLNEVDGHGAAVRDIVRDANVTVGPPFVNPSLHNFSPRAGFAWDVQGNSKTAVRGGFGLLYDIGNLGSSLVVGATATPPLSSVSTVANPTAFVLPFFFPQGAAGRSLRTIDYHLNQPHMLQYNLTIERQLPGDMAITLAYAGSRGLHLMMSTEGNPTLPQGISQNGQCVRRAAGQTAGPGQPSCWVGGDPRINPAWGSIEYKTANSNSFYHSLQLGLAKRLSRGLQFQTSYTWSKLQDEVQSQLGNFENLSSSSWPSNPLNRKLDRAPASFDITQNLRFNAIYRFPAYASQAGWQGSLLNGWWTSGILSLQTGYPFTPILLTNRSRSGVGGGGAPVDRPNLVPGRNNGNITSGTTAGCPWAPAVRAGQSLGTPDLYYDPCAFTLQPAGFLGSASRNSLRGPGLANLDFSLVKDTSLKHLGENGKLEFRAEVFNLLNRANFATSGIGITTDNSAQVFAGRADNETVLPTAARLTTTATKSRQIQFALKILF